MDIKHNISGDLVVKVNFDEINDEDEKVK